MKQWFPRFAEIEAPISVSVIWMHLYFDDFSDEMIHVAGFCVRGVWFHLLMKMEPKVSSETSAIRNQTREITQKGTTYIEETCFACPSLLAGLYMFGKLFVLDKLCYF